jgi:drug/metabolite transporter (DMT)-like permease
MVGVCITIITLFKAMKIHMETLADEIVGIDTSMFIGAAIFAYAALRKENNGRLKKIADLLFFIGMLILLIVGFIIVFSNY